MKFVFLLTTFIVFLTSCSHQQVTKDTARSVAAINLEWFAARDDHTKNASCRQTLPLASEEIKLFFQKKYEKHEKNESKLTINGMTFINENSNLVFSLKLLLSASDKLAKNTPSDFKKIFPALKNCKDALCASEIIFGKNIGPQMLFLMDEFSLNTSPYSFLNAQLFKADELADIILSLELLPPHLRKFNSNKKLIRYTQGQVRPNSPTNVLANASMEIFDSWSRKNSYRRQYIMFHEYAHNLALSHLTNLDNSLYWLKLSDWNKNANALFIAKKEIEEGHPFVSEYGQTNPFEDFAESVSAYRLNPKLLKKMSPLKYEYLKYLVFDGLEFNTQNECSRNPQNTRFQREILANKYPFTQKEIVHVFEACRNQFFRLSFSNDSYDRFQSCINYEASLIWYKKAEKKYANLAPHTIFNPQYGLSSLKFPTIILHAKKLYAKESAHWLTNQLLRNSGQYHNAMSTQQYCEMWSQISIEKYGDKSMKSFWEYLPVNTNSTYIPTKSALKLLCSESLKSYNPMIINQQKNIVLRKIKNGPFFDKEKLNLSIEKSILEKTN